MKTQIAYSLLETKALDEDKRIFRGWATTPEADRVGDSINPMGAKFANPIVLLHQHQHNMPIGTVLFQKPTGKGIQFEASIPNIEEPGPLKDRVDTAWLEIKHGLVRGVSIGFRPLKYAYMDSGGIDFQEIEIYELSSVSVPANAAATIQTIKALGSHREATRGVRLITRAANVPRDLKGAIPLIRR
jgi:uncharacterized protein